MCLVRRFWGDSAEQAKKCSTPSDRSVASGKRPTLLSELDAAQPQTDRTDQLGSERESSPSPNGRGAERCGRVVEKNCIMWVDKLVLWEYTWYSQLDDMRFEGGQPKSCCRSNKNVVMSVLERKSIYCAYLGA